MNLIFESERLVFRPLSEADLDLAIEQWTDPDVVRYAADRIYTKEELAEEMPIVVRRCAAGCIGIWCLIDKTTKEKLGTAILLPMPVELDDIDWDLVVGEQIPEGDIEIGFILKKPAWGKGYATEACKRLLKFAFEESPLEEIVATIDPENTASRRVLEKCGLVYQGLVRAYASDIPGFRITRQQWRRRNTPEPEA
jgi:RimJ/RimL family protein N-acetyltransferase